MGRSYFKLATKAVVKGHPADERSSCQRMTFDPMDVARQLEPKRKQGSRLRCASSRSPCKGTSALVDRLVKKLEVALDPACPGRESLLTCKAVTDAFLVNARYLRCTIGGDFLLRTIRRAWRHAIEHWNDGQDETHSAADLHLTALWFKAWSAADNISGGGEPIIDMYEMHRMLPGDWIWVLDHLEIAGAPEGLYLDEEIELDAIHEQERKLPREIWGLKEIRRVLLGVSDDEWFKEGGNMLDLTLDGPDRPSTFRKVFAGTPGAIYGCLKDQHGDDAIPPTFRMYSTSAIFDALGEEVMLRSRDDISSHRKRFHFPVEGEYSSGDEVSLSSSGGWSHSPSMTSPKRRQIVALVELQVSWVEGRTHLLAWLDFMRV